MKSFAIIVVLLGFAVNSVSYALMKADDDDSGGGGYSGLGGSSSFENSDGSTSSVVVLAPVTVTAPRYAPSGGITTISIQNSGPVDLGQVVVVARNGKYAPAAAVVPLVLTTSFYTNEGIVCSKLLEILKIANPASRLAALRALLSSAQAAINAGAPLTYDILAVVQNNINASRAMMLLGKTFTGYISIEMLASIPAAAAAGYIGYQAGTAIYNNSAWVQNGGFDPFFHAIDRALGRQP